MRMGAGTVSVCSSGLRVFFFFKQKTAYEMRISDWSSDVCSADLHIHPPARRFLQRRPLGLLLRYPQGRPLLRPRPRRAPRHRHPPRVSQRARHPVPRSEEHTSELQSLMRISYAVFCLKKKNIIYKPSYTNPITIIHTYRYTNI